MNGGGKVQRYNDYIIIGDEKGGFVKYADYAELKAENEQLKNKIRELNYEERRKRTGFYKVQQ